MWKEERFQKIRTLLQTYGRVTIKRAAEDLDASRETIRRDFSEMEQLGELKKIRGGAIALDPEQEPPISLRNNEQRKEKAAIAKRSTEDLEAYSLYLKGSYYSQIQTAEGFKKSIEFFEQSLQYYQKSLSANLE